VLGNGADFGKKTACTGLKVGSKQFILPCRKAGICIIKGQDLPSIKWEHDSHKTIMLPFFVVAVIRIWKLLRMKKMLFIFFYYFSSNIQKEKL